MKDGICGEGDVFRAVPAICRFRLARYEFWYADGLLGSRFVGAVEVCAGPILYRLVARDLQVAPVRADLEAHAPACPHNIGLHWQPPNHVVELE